MAPPGSEADTDWLAEPCWATSTRAYEPDDEGCLQLSKGQWIYVQYVGEGENADWNYGTDESGASAGWFPADLAAFHEEEEEAASADEDEDLQVGSADPSTSSPPLASAFSTQAQALVSEMPANAEQRKEDHAEETSGGHRPMLSGKAQREEARRLADMQAKPLDDSAKQAIAKRRALSAERRTAAELDAANRAGGQSELQAKLARRRAAADAEKAPPSAPAPQVPKTTTSAATEASAPDSRMPETTTSATTGEPAEPKIQAESVAPLADVVVADALVVAEPARDLPVSPPLKEENSIDGGNDTVVREQPTSEHPACACCSMM